MATVSKVSSTQTSIRVRITGLENPANQYVQFRIRSYGSYSDASSDSNRLQSLLFSSSSTTTSTGTITFSSGMACSNTYYFRGWANWGGTWYELSSSSPVQSHSTDACDNPRPTDWTWTTTERNAMNGQGNFSTITYLRWNSFLQRVDDFCDYYGTSRLSSSLYRSSSNKVLYASHFRDVSNKLHTMSGAVASACRNVQTGDEVMGWYFTNLESAFQYIS